MGMGLTSFLTDSSLLLQSNVFWKLRCLSGHCRIAQRWYPIVDRDTESVMSVRGRGGVPGTGGGGAGGGGQSRVFRAHASVAEEVSPLVSP